MGYRHFLTWHVSKSIVQVTKVTAHLVKLLNSLPVPLGPQCKSSDFMMYVFVCLPVRFHSARRTKVYVHELGQYLSQTSPADRLKLIVKISHFLACSFSIDLHWVYCQQYFKQWTKLLSLRFPCNQFVFPVKLRVKLTPYSEPFPRNRSISWGRGWDLDIDFKVYSFKKHKVYIFSR